MQLLVLFEVYRDYHKYPFLHSLLTTSKVNALLLQQLLLEKIGADPEVPQQNDTVVTTLASEIARLSARDISDLGQLFFHQKVSELLMPKDVQAEVGNFFIGAFNAENDQLGPQICTRACSIVLLTVLPSCIAQAACSHLM